MTETRSERGNAAPAAGAPAGAVTLRTARQGDVRAICEIEDLSFADPWTATSFTALITDPRVDFRVAEDSGSVVGYVILWSVLDESELANIAVAPEARGRGLGALLLDAVLQSAHAAGSVTTHLEVRESNVAARALYASRGFSEVRRRKGYYRRPEEDAVVMARNSE